MKTLFVRIVKIAGIVIAILIAILALGALIAAVVYGPEYVRRMLVWRESTFDIYMEGFPSAALDAAPVPFYFDEAEDERVSALYASIFGAEDFEVFLEEKDTQAFLVIQDDAIIYEGYFNGFQRESLLTSYSVAKSFTSALIGSAIADGYINGVDDPITEYLPELAERDERFKDITIRHLLMMASGLEFKEDRPLLFNGDGPLSSYYPDQRKVALEFTKIIDPPGQYFRYNKYHPQLLGLILERSTGMRVTTYLQEKLWDPLGMEFAGSWSTDSQESDFEKMETGVNARAVDYAKLGRLFLEKGSWNGSQLIPEDWVLDSLTFDPSTQNTAYYPDEFGQLIYDNLNGYYKYMWYGYFRGEDGYDFAAEGDRGQIIYVSPQKDLIIVRNGLTYGIPMEEWLKGFYAFATDF